MKQNYDFYADAVATQEVTISLLLASIFKLYPEIAQDFTANLQVLLKNHPLHNVNVKNNLQKLLDFAISNQPKPASAQ